MKKFILLFAPLQTYLFQYGELFFSTEIIFIKKYLFKKFKSISISF